MDRTKSVDRISGLPDHVICRILSFLSTKSSVRTSILAKEWRFVWVGVQSLGFTCNIGHGRECGAETTVDDSKIINTFHICSAAESTDNYEFESWIATIFARNVRNLVIGLNFKFSLPRCLFTCQTLVDLRILDCRGIPVDSTVYFPALRKLELDNICYDEATSIPHLISGCPVLEELTLNKMGFCCCCFVSSPTLRRLVMNIDDATIILLHNNPALKYLRLRGYNKTRDIFLISTLDSVIEADIDLSQGIFSYSFYVIRFLEKYLCNVKCLTLSTGRIEVLDSDLTYLPTTFHNLTELRLCADWYFITKIIENANNLRVLSIRRTVDQNVQSWKAPNQPPACLVSHLEIISLVNFDWSTEHEFDMAGYILRNARVLKRMEIIYTQDYKLDWNEKVESLNVLASVETRSTYLLLKLYSLSDM